MTTFATPEPAPIPHLGHHVVLGKQEPKKDARTLKFAKYVTKAIAQLPAPPARVARSDSVPNWPMYGNDSLPDCTIAAAGHMIQLWTAVAGRAVTPADADVLHAFSATGPMDQGRYELDVLNYWRHTGIGGDKILAYVKIDPKNDVHMQLAIWLFGAVYAGLALPRSAQAQTDPSKTWMVGRGPSADAGSWGGHAVPIVNFWRSRKRYGAITWGFLQPMTWGFWHAYGDEAYAVLSQDWVNAAGDSPVPGFNLQKLLDDLKGIDVA